MIIGVHALLNTTMPDEVRAFFRDVLGFGSVDAGRGWLIFGLPPAELGIHPREPGEQQGSACELYLMCDDLDATIAELTRRGVHWARPVTEARFGRMTALVLPDGSALGLYEPRHPLALGLHGAAP